MSEIMISRVNHWPFLDSNESDYYYYCIILALVTSPPLRAHKDPCRREEQKPLREYNLRDIIMRSLVI